MNEQFLRIKDGSFIDKFDPQKHKLEKFKLILVLGKASINGKNQDGNCLFIPFDNWNAESQEGDCQDGDTDWYWHYNYLVRALTNTKYTFPDRFITIIDLAKKTINSPNGGYRALYEKLAFQGVCVIANLTYENVNGDSSLEYGYFIPSMLTDEQKKTLLEIKKELELNPENSLGINQYTSKTPINVTNRRTSIEYDKQHLDKLNIAGEICNYSCIKDRDGYIFSYLLRQGDFKIITLEEFLKLLNDERSI